MRLGLTRKEAYLAMAERTSVDDLIRFVRAIVQAEQYGVSVSGVVRSQSDEVRFARRKRAEAEALRLPVKILFPLMLCILPVLFAIILTPAAIQIFKTLGDAT
jgi:tight adherence protein C